MAKLTKIEGIDEATAEVLRAAGIRTTGTLIKQGASPEGRSEIAEQTGLDEALILRWISHVDFFRISGVGAEYAALLELADVHDVPDLASRQAENVYRLLAKVNREQELVKKLPTRYQINDWVKQARRLPALITY
jgi:predicted flap endonuclease-1-like 5' DNA nuclease